MRMRWRLICPKCRGVKHIRTSSGYVRCSCLTNEIVTNGVKEHAMEGFTEGGWNSFESSDQLNFLKSLANETHGIYDIFSGTAKVRWKIVGLILHDILGKNHQIHITGLSQLVQAHFDKTIHVYERFVRCDAFWLRLDFVRRHAWNASVFTDFTTSRGSKLTFLTSRNPLTHPLFEIKIINVSKVKLKP